MSKSLNQVTIYGNLTRDPELRQTPNGQTVCNLTLALNRSYKDSTGAWVETADFVDVVAWGPLGENISKWVFKGRPLLVVGRLQSRQWEQDGQKRSKLEVVASDVTFMPSDKKSDQSRDIVTDDDISDDSFDLSSIPF